MIASSAKAKLMGTTGIANAGSTTNATSLADKSSELAQVEPFGMAVFATGLRMSTRVTVNYKFLLHIV